MLGDRVHRNRLRRLGSKYMEDATIRAVYEVGETIRADAQESIKAGAVSGPGHVPSAPGTPPNADTHNLDKSIDVVMSANRKSVSVIARAPYAAAQEYGTARLPARPYMRPAMQRNKTTATRVFVQAVQGEVRVYKTSTRGIQGAGQFIRSGGTRGF